MDQPAPLNEWPQSKRMIAPLDLTRENAAYEKERSHCSAIIGGRSP